MIVTGLEAGDERRHEILVAGPSALLVAKLHKVADRTEQPGRQRPRDAHDVFRLLREVEVEAFADGFAAMKAADVSHDVALEAIGHASPGEARTRVWIGDGLETLIALKRAHAAKLELALRSLRPRAGALESA